MSLRSRIATVLALVAIGLSITVNAENGGLCSNETLHGSYAFHATGELFAAVARFTFDGQGGLTAIFFGRSPGNPFGPVPLTGTYSVDSNCIVTDEWGGSIHHSVIYGHGKGYFIINSSTDVSANADSVNSGEAIRQ
jgi:hypothetical protein